jgi:hypothetical protein
MATKGANCSELHAAGHFAWDVPWQGLKSLRENWVSWKGTASAVP